MATTDTTPLSALSIVSGAKRSPRKLALLNTAIELFAERGYDRVTIRELGDQMGMTSASLYRHYDGKAALLADAVDLVIHPLIQELESIRASEDEAFERLERAVSFHAQFAVDHRTYLHVYYMEARHLTEQAQRRHRELATVYRDHWVDLILAADAAESPAEARVVYAMAMAMLNFGSNVRRSGKPPAVRRILVQRTMAMLTGG